MRNPITRARRADNPGGYSPIWPPTKLPGCVAWYDMLETYTESGGTVTAIRNMVTGSDDMAEATNPPALDLAGINGLPCFVGNGSDMRLLSTEAAVVAALAGAAPHYTLLCAMQPVASASNHAFFAAGDSGVASLNTAYFGRFTPNQRWGLERRGQTAIGGDSASCFNGPGEALYHPQVFSNVAANGQVTVRTNLGELLSPDKRGTFSAVGSGYGLLQTDSSVEPNRVAFLCRPDSAPDSFSPDKIGCLLLYNRAHSDSAVLGLVSALMGRWRIPA